MLVKQRTRDLYGTKSTSAIWRQVHRHYTAGIVFKMTFAFQIENLVQIHNRQAKPAALVIIMVNADACLLRLYMTGQLFIC